MEIRVEFTADILRSERCFEGVIDVPDNFREMDPETQKYYLRSHWKEWVAETAYGDYREVEEEGGEDE